MQNQSPILQLFVVISNFFAIFFMQNRAFTTNKLCRKYENYFSHIMLIVSKLNLVDT